MIRHPKALPNTRAPTALLARSFGEPRREGHFCTLRRHKYLMSVTPHNLFADCLIDTQMIAPIRLVLATPILSDPSQPDRLVGLTYSSLTGYTVHCAMVLLVPIARRAD